MPLDCGHLLSSHFDLFIFFFKFFSLTNSASNQKSPSHTLSLIQKSLSHTCTHLSIIIIPFQEDKLIINNPPKNNKSSKKSYLSTYSTPSLHQLTSPGLTINTSNLDNNKLTKHFGAVAGEVKLSSHTQRKKKHKFFFFKKRS